MQYDPTHVLPPDSATVTMTLRAADIARRNKVAQLLYDGESPDGMTAIDLGAGSGVIGAALMAVVPNLLSVTSVDNDIDTLPYARRNMLSANEARLRKSMGDVACNVLRGDWNDDSLWTELGPADIITCNPPYLLPLQKIRPGYELTRPGHLYAVDGEGLTKSYGSIITHAVRAMRRWDTVAVRLPKGSYKEDRDVWLPMVSRHIEAGIAASSDEAYYVSHTQRFWNDGDRPLHALVIEKLPVDYPAINPLGDARLDIYMLKGKDVGPLTKAPHRRPNEQLLIADRL